MRVEVGNRVEFETRSARGRRVGIVHAIASNGRRESVVAKLSRDDLLIVFDDAGEPFHVAGGDVVRVFVRRSVIIASTKIVRDEDGEFRVKAFDASGNRVPRCDYFTDDRDDAKATAAAMIAKSREIDVDPAELEELTLGAIVQLGDSDRAELLAMVRYYFEIDVAEPAFDAIPVRIALDALAYESCDDSLAQRLADLIRLRAREAGVKFDEPTIVGPYGDEILDN